MIRENTNKLSVENLKKRIEELEKKVAELMPKEEGKKSSKKKQAKKGFDENDF